MLTYVLVNQVNLLFRYIFKIVNDTSVMSIIVIISLSIGISSLCKSQTIFKETCDERSSNGREFNYIKKTMESRLLLFEKEMKEEFESHKKYVQNALKIQNSQLVEALELLRNDTRLTMQDHRMSVLNEISNISTSVQNIQNSETKMMSKFEKSMNDSYEVLSSMLILLNDTTERRLSNLEERFNESKYDIDLLTRNTSIIENNLKESFSEGLQLCMRTNNLSETRINQMSQNLTYMSSEISVKFLNSENRMNLFDTTLNSAQRNISSLLGSVMSVQNSVQSLSQSNFNQNAKLNILESQQNENSRSITHLSTGLDSFITIRLVGGSSNFGRVEVNYDGVWGTICDDEWDNNDANVVCKMIGYSSGGAAHGEAVYGQGSGQIWLDNVQCTGTESSLMKCSKLPFGKHNCQHSEDAGVYCY